MRKLAVASLLLTMGACGRSDVGEVSKAAALPSTGPDPVIVRIPHDGGIARAYRYPRLDSLVWKGSEPAPAIERILAFDAENATLAYVASTGVPGWIDLRIGSVRAATKAALTAISSADGSAIFGVTSSNEVKRFTPSGDWSHEVSRKVRRLFPLPDGTLLVLVDQGDESVILKLRPPDDAVTDSVSVPRPERAAVTALGDRVYLGAKDALVAVRPQTLAKVDKVSAGDEILALASTPSGDRIFVANKGGPRLEVVDRYSENVKNSVTLPGLVTELRMDPLGRYLLARPIAGDSAWVVAIGTETLVGTVRTEWRLDLPAVAADGLVASVRGRDVEFVDPKGGSVRQTVKDGANDLWFFTVWNGFRARAQGIDRPVSFSLGEGTASNAQSDSVIKVRPPVTPTSHDSVLRPVAPTGNTTVEPPPPPPPPPPTRDSWTVSFAAVLSEARARKIVETIAIDGQHPRVIQGQTAGTTVFRVVFGPYNSKAEAERIGKSSKHNFWVYEGVP
ncbi:MAG: SPOR domain-containing protein [Gemmatimonadaceae bacterium]